MFPCASGVAETLIEKVTAVGWPGGILPRFFGVSRIDSTVEGVAQLFPTQGTAQACRLATESVYSSLIDQLVKATE